MRAEQARLTSEKHEKQVEKSPSTLFIYLFLLNASDKFQIHFEEHMNKLEKLLRDITTLLKRSPGEGEELELFE